LQILLWLAVAVAAYLLGSFPAGYLVGRLWGVDVLYHGSGRTGGTNLLRAAGPVAALVTGSLDVGKGALAVWLAGYLTGTPAMQAVAGGAVVLGHIHSVFLGFRGGGGVGTSLGALAVLSFPVAAGLLLLLLAVIAATRYASVGSLTVATLMPVVLLALGIGGLLPLIYTLYGLLAWFLILYAHRPNIRRLKEGTERRLGNSTSVH